MSRINVLSKEVSELIAAGEVIDRPSAIVKELLENAIDAGANIITVEIKNGGRTYIRVTDNGSGINKEDISKAFLRHATSKISSKDDLSSIMTLGFRGEALASISAVSKIDVLTKNASETYGTHYVIEGSIEKTSEQCGCPDGTTFVVRDIFYNVPARLKFLKKDVTEGNYIADLVNKLSLSHPEISFKFIRDNRAELITAGDGKLYSSINAVFGRQFAASLIPVDSVWNNICVTGFTVKPLAGKQNRKFQNFFVNGRYVKSDICSKAIEEAYQNSIMIGKFPVCVINIKVSPEIIDVNVHPTKIDVRFSDNKIIYDAIYFSIKDALLKEDKPTEMILEKKKYFSEKELYVIPEQKKDVQLKYTISNVSDKEDKIDISDFENNENVKKSLSNASFIKSNSEYKDDLFLNSLNNSSKNKFKSESIINTVICKQNNVKSNIDKNKKEDLVDTENDTGTFKYISDKSFEKKIIISDDNEEKTIKPIVIGEAFKTYIIAQAGDDILLFDKHAAHERYIFEKIKSNTKEPDVQFLFETTYVMLSYDEYDAVCSNIEKVKKLGFEIEPDTAPNVAVKGIPMILGDNYDPKEIVSELAKNFLELKHNPQLDIFDELYHSMACKAAIKANDNSDILELQKLVDIIYDRDDIKYCPHGRPVMIKLSKRDIEKQFKRIV